MKNLLILSLSLITLASATFAETLPAPPTKYFDDRTGTINTTESARLNERLASIEKNSPGNPQFIVSILKFDTSSTLEDYCNRIAKSWKVGQKDKNNGIILFWFPETRKLRFEIGYGNEGLIPDSLSKRILDQQIIPQFKKKNYVAGLDAGINKVNEYLNKEIVPVKAKSAQNQNQESGIGGIIFLFGIGGIGLIIGIIAAFRKQDKTLDEELNKISSRPVEPFIYTPPVVKYKETPKEKNRPRSVRPDYVAPIIAAAAAASIPVKKTEIKKEKKKSSYDSGSSSGGSSFGSFGGGSSDSGSSFSGGGGDFGGGGSSGDY